MTVFFLYYVFFFFPTEDGIRDYVESRGLGDLEKGQLPPPPHFMQTHHCSGIYFLGNAGLDKPKARQCIPFMKLIKPYKLKRQRRINLNKNT